MCSKNGSVDCAAALPAGLIKQSRTLIHVRRASRVGRKRIAEALSLHLQGFVDRPRLGLCSIRAHAWLQVTNLPCRIVELHEDPQRRIIQLAGTCASLATATDDGGIAKVKAISSITVVVFLPSIRLQFVSAGYVRPCRGGGGRASI